MKIFVIGAGYVGMALLNSFENLDHEIYVSTTKEERIDELKSHADHVIVLDPKEDGNLKRTLDTSDVIIILVAPKGSDLYEETYLGTAKRITAFLKEREKPFYLLYTSSTSVYEGSEEEWAQELAGLNPSTKNGKILLETENIYLKAGNTCVLRLGGIYGPGRDFVGRARRLSGLELLGTGETPTNHIHLDDIVSAIHFCLDHRLKGIYNLVNESHPERKTLYGDLCEALNIPQPKWKGNHERGYKVSNQKIIQAGFSFQHPSIPKTKK
jgi:nucleoside-diphosphate-sugar epimerase